MTDSTVFIDDSIRNVEAAIAKGLRGVHFQGASKLRTELHALGILLPGQGD